MTLKFNNATVNEVYLNRNAGYQIQGSPTITNGIVSGFSSSDYFTVSSSSIDFSKPWEIVLCAKYATSSGTTYFLGANGFTIKLYNNSLQASIKLNGSSTWDWQSGGIYSLTNGETIFAKLEFTGTQYIFSYLTNGKQWTTGNSYSSSTPIANSALISFGYYGGATFLGSIDLNETYIKINGITWFNGKQQASNAVNALQINGNTVWQR